MTNFRPTDRLSGFVMPPSVDEWLPQTQLARFVADVVVAQGDQRVKNLGSICVRYWGAISSRQ